MQCFNFETSVLKTKNFFQKLEDCFLVESNTTESATYPYKTTLSKANVKISGMGSTKWTCHKQLLYFFEKLILVQEPLINSQYNSFSNSHIHAFCERLSFTWKYVFPASIFNWYGTWEKEVKSKKWPLVLPKNTRKLPYKKSGATAPYDRVAVPPCYSSWLQKFDLG